MALQDYSIELLPPEIWRPRIEEMVENTPKGPMARSILKSIHDRHVGITPELAAGLAAALADSGKSLSTNGVWQAVFNRLLDELDLDNSQEKKEGSLLRKRKFGIIGNVNPSYVIFRLGLPLVDLACRKLGKCYLFCKDDIPTQVGLHEYEKYAQELSQCLQQLTEDNGITDLFWREKAQVLSGFSKGLMARGQMDFRLPDTNATALGYLFRLEPDLSETRRNTRQIKRLTSPAKQNNIRMRKEEGIDGIRMARGEEDLGSILFSEFINDDILLMDKLINTGYLAVQREPKHQKVRDVLIAAILPGEFHGRLNGDFIKACWYHAVMRLGTLLRDQQLLKSDFRWLEGDRLHRLKECTFHMEDLFTTESMQAAGPIDTFNQEFMTALKWLPPFLDGHSRFHPIKQTLPDPDPVAEGIEEPADKIRKWAVSAWLNQDSQRTAPNKGTRENLSDLNEYALIHLMVFMPAGEKENMEDQPGPLSLGRLLRDFRLGNHERRHVSITWVPENIEAADRWHYGAQGKPASPVFHAPQTHLTENEIAGKLCDTWLSQWKKEIRLG